jgi:hypothetical protein
MLAPLRGPPSVAEPESGRWSPQHRGAPAALAELGAMRCHDRATERWSGALAADPVAGIARVALEHWLAFSGRSRG